WFDRSGRQIDTIGPQDAYRHPALSPDGKRLIVERPDQQTGKFDLWLQDLTRGTMSRFTFDAANDSAGAWSPDGTRIIFYSERDPAGFYVKPLGGGAEELAFKTDALGPEQWSGDGTIVYDATTAKTSNDVLTFAFGKNPSAVPVVETPFA